jgi:hypothetical protein
MCATTVCRRAAVATTLGIVLAGVFLASRSEELVDGKVASSPVPPPTVPTGFLLRVAERSVRAVHTEGNFRISTSYATFVTAPQDGGLPVLRQETGVYPVGQPYSDPVHGHIRISPLRFEATELGWIDSDTLLVAGLLPSGETVVDRIDFDPPQLVYNVVTGLPDKVLPAYVSGTQRILSVSDPTMSVVSGLSGYPPDPTGYVVVQFASSGDVYRQSTTVRDLYTLMASADAARAAAAGALNVPGLETYFYDHTGGRHVASGQDLYASFSVETFDELIEAAGYPDLATSDYNPLWDDIVQGVILVDDDRDGVFDSYLDATENIIGGYNWSDVSSWQ